MVFKDVFYGTYFALNQSLPSTGNIEEKDWSF